MAYRLTASDAVIREIDGASIPSDPANIDRAAYNEWLAAGGVPDLAQVVPLTMANYQQAVALHTDKVAQARGYLDATRLMAWASAPHPVWAAEGAAFLAWQVQVHLEAFRALAAVQAGETPPTIEKFIAGLPLMAWPLS